MNDKIINMLLEALISKAEDSDMSKLFADSESPEVPEDEYESESEESGESGTDESSCGKPEDVKAILKLFKSGM